MGIRDRNEAVRVRQQRFTAFADIRRPVLTIGVHRHNALTSIRVQQKFIERRLHGTALSLVQTCLLYT